MEQHFCVNSKARQALNRQKSFVIWFTGLPASGKSTLSNALECVLHKNGYHTYLLDGDNLRRGLCRDLGFTKEDRRENIRRVAELAKLFVDAGIITLTSLISPYQRERELARKLFNQGEFIEIHVKCPLHECERRDPKGLYRRARQGEINCFTGVSAPYEEPVNPEIILETARCSVTQAVGQIMSYLEGNNYLDNQ